MLKRSEVNRGPAWLVRYEVLEARSIRSPQTTFEDPPQERAKTGGEREVVGVQPPKLGHTVKETSPVADRLPFRRKGAREKSMESNGKTWVP